MQPKAPRLVSGISLGSISSLARFGSVCDCRGRSSGVRPFGREFKRSLGVSIGDRNLQELCFLRSHPPAGSTRYSVGYGWYLRQTSKLMQVIQHELGRQKIVRAGYRKTVM